MGRAPWPTAGEVSDWAFVATSRVEFRREVMQRLMRCTGSAMAIFTDAVGPVAPVDVIDMDPKAADAARQTVLAHPAEVARATRRLAERGVMVDTSLYAPREWQRLPHIAEHQLAMGISSNLVLSWHRHLEPPVVLNLCRARGRFGEDDELAAGGIVRAIAVADGSLAARQEGADAALAGLTERQREIIEYVRRGYTNPEIASACRLSAFTVRNHLALLFEQFGVCTRTELALLFSDRLRGPGSVRLGFPSAVA